MSRSPECMDRRPTRADAHGTSLSAPLGVRHCRDLLRDLDVNRLPAVENPARTGTGLNERSTPSTPAQAHGFFATLPPSDDIAGYRARFVYRIHGHALRGTLYPPRTVLYRKDRVSCVRGGEHLWERRLKPDSPTRPTFSPRSNG